MRFRRRGSVAVVVGMPRLRPRSRRTTARAPSDPSNCGSKTYGKVGGTFNRGFGPTTKTGTTPANTVSHMRALILAPSRDQAFRRVLLAVLALPLSTWPALAQQQVTLTGAGSTLSNNVYVGPYTVYVGPYTGSVPGMPTLDLFCIDYMNGVAIGDTWSAHFTSLSSGDLGNTRFGQQYGAASQVMYQQAAWLSMQFARTGTGSWGAIHAAIWHIFTPNDPTWGGTAASAWLTQAQQVSNYGTVNLNTWRVVTDVATVGGQGGTQEYLTHVTPEPGTLLLLATGLAAVGLAVFVRRVG
jgi:hypothetical protein